ncbi:RsmE family RNA methyltransferase [Sorangium sp. So ce281]|uniref:RsmE family RNA methyltransferase n=1 Tax=unclassified Sorangium TaxID=2621164 RepID=UPI003F5F5D92
MSGPGLLRVPLGAIAAGVIALPPEAASYVVRVHRLREGDRFVVFDPELGVEAEATLESIGRRGAEARIDAPRPAALRPGRRVTWIQAVGKGDKMDAVVRDATELGATRIIPAISARSVARPAEERSQRWRRIAIEAARQCGRGDAPRVEAPMSLAAALAEAGAAPSTEGGALGMCLDPYAETPLGARLAALSPGMEAAFAVGPEGGFTPEELGMCAALGFERVRLGALTLRTETVCAAALGALIAVSDAHAG